MKLNLFDYNLPEKYIAQKPLPQRDKSKLLILDKKSGAIKHDIFLNLPGYVNSKDILVVNESKVAKCRLFGKKEETGAKIECFVLNRVKDNRYLALLKPSKRLKVSSKVFVEDYCFVVKSKLDYGKAIIEFNAPPDVIFEKFGKIPLPPYIKNDDIDESCYQTIYAKEDGSAASPTAGLHFTKNLISRLKAKGVKFAKVRLDIGLDTFRPVVEEEIKDHKMHSEYYSISKLEAEKINSAKKNGGRVIAVGTTSTRVLETVISKNGIITKDSGLTDLYIYPGYKFKIVDCMITNFHIPKSTLLIMVSAFAERKNILNAYSEAKRNGYRFYSFGDCMMIV